MNSEEQEDIEISCIDCDEWFVWSWEEQQYYRTKSLEEPKRCKSCASQRRKHYGNTRDIYRAPPELVSVFLNRTGRDAFDGAGWREVCSVLCETPEGRSFLGRLGWMNRG